MKEVLDQFRFGVVICDECHYLKNQRAARTKVTVQMQARFLWAEGRLCAALAAHLLLLSC